MDKHKIVVVDDEPTIVELLTRSLQKKNYAVTGFTNPKEALEHLKTHEVNLLLTDLNMPDMSGIELIKSTLGLKPNLPVVLMTGAPDLVPMDIGTAYLVKPFQLDRLEHIIESILFTENGVINHNK